MNNFKEIELFAKENYIPIARKQTVEFIINLIKENNYQSFFEIGTAIGYTSIYLASTFNQLDIWTIEHDLNRAKMAKENMKDFKVEDRIKFIIGNAITYSPDRKFDVIFIDASKKRNRFYLEKFLNNLTENGTIIIDNMHLDDFWVGANKDKKAYYDSVNEELKNYIKSTPLYDYKFYDDIGDGIVVIKIKKNLNL